MNRKENKKENLLFPVLKPLISSISNFNDIKKLSKIPPENLNCTSHQNVENIFSSIPKQQFDRKKITNMLKINRQELREIHSHQKERMNITFLKLVKMYNDPSIKTKQQKMKKQRRETNINTNVESVAYSSINLQQKQPLQKLLHGLSISVQKIQFYNYQSFYAFREGSCLAVCDKQLYLHGGYTAQFDNHKSFLHKFDFTKKMWIQMNQKGQFPTVTKLGQTVEQWKNNLVYIGGMSINIFGKKRTFFNEILIYNPQKQEWTKNKSIQGRRYHTTIKYNNVIMVYGGINQKQDYIRSIQTVNLLNHSIHTYYLSDDDDGIAYHKTISTLQLDAKKKNLFLEDGIFAFGGKNNNGEFLQGLRVLKCQINNNNQIVPKKWIRPKTEGQGPQTRINHTMNFLQKIASICIIGGQNYNSEPLKDVFILNLYNLNWYRPEISFDQFLIKGITRHTSCVLGSKIFIYGGYTGQKIYNTCLIEVQTDKNKINLNSFYKSKRLIQIQRTGQKKPTINNIIQAETQ